MEKVCPQAKHQWWLTPVILAAWEAKIWRITVPSHPTQKKFPRPHLKRKKAGLVACPDIPARVGSIK
jgi:hypothetical protein